MGSLLTASIIIVPPFSKPMPCEINKFETVIKVNGSVHFHIRSNVCSVYWCKLEAAATRVILLACSPLEFLPKKFNNLKVLLKIKTAHVKLVY